MIAQRAEYASVTSAEDPGLRVLYLIIFALQPAFTGHHNP